MPKNKMGLPPTDKELDIDFGDYTSFSELAEADAKKEHELLVEEEKKIAIVQEAAKKALVEKPGNPLAPQHAWVPLVAKSYESGQQWANAWLPKQKSIPGSSHDKSGKFGGVSSYSDEDVAQARSYMQTVLGIESMSVNGRALEHILAEVYGFAKRDSEMEVRNLKSKMKLQDGLESQITQLKTMLGIVSIKLEEAEVQLKEHAKYVEVAKKIDKEAVVAKTSTGRRIKE